MEKNSFEQEFIHNVKQTTPPQVIKPQPANLNPNASAKTSKLSFIAIIILAIIALVEAVALVVMAINLQAEPDEELVEDELDDYAVSNLTPYEYDNEDNIVALNLTCESEDGNQFAFTKAKQYTKSSGSAPEESGTYSMLKNTAIILNNGAGAGEEKIVYYDGIYVIDGTTFYSCEEEINDQETP